MNPETRQEIVMAGVRWANNILVEVLSNHARAVSPSGADKLRQAVSLLDEASRDFRNRSESVERRLLGEGQRMSLGLPADLTGGNG